MHPHRQTKPQKSNIRKSILTRYIMQDYHFQELLDIMDRLRVECPWDKKQTFDSIRCNTIEETYELSDAIIEKNYPEIKKELGDLLLHIVFYSKMGSELSGDDYFDINDVTKGICEKLIRRHPHIYGSVTANTSEDVLQNWEKIKIQSEKRKSVLEGVPKSLPAMIKAYRIQEKAHGIGFDWDNKEQVWDKVKEELEELQSEIKADDNRENLEMEFGDVLFALINYARFLNINPEDALEKSNRKFISRFQKVEQKVAEHNQNLTEMTLEQLDKYWNEAKSEEKDK